MMSARPKLKRVGVIGGGTMGSGIAQVFALRGFGVTLVDVSAEVLERARRGIDTSLSRMVKKESIGAVAKEEAKQASVRHGEAAERLNERSRELSTERRANRRVATSLHESRSSERAALVELETAGRALEETIANLRRAPALRSSPEAEMIKSAFWALSLSRAI